MLGATVYDGSRHLLGGLDEALERAHESAGVQTGSLRITLPFRAWQLVIVPKLSAFQAAFPGIVLDLNIEDGLTNIIAHGFHAGIRLGDHLQDDMIAVRLSRREEAAYVASPAYLARHGVPVTPDDLLRHRCIRHRRVSSGQVSDWTFSTPQGEVTADVRGNLILDDLRAVVDAAVGGLGIGWSLLRGVREEIATGALVQVLAESTTARPGFFLYYPKSLRTLAILRRFIEHFREG